LTAFVKCVGLELLFHLLFPPPVPFCPLVDNYYSVKVIFYSNPPIGFLAPLCPPVNLPTPPSSPPSISFLSCPAPICFDTPRKFLIFHFFSHSSTNVRHFNVDLPPHPPFNKTPPPPSVGPTPFTIYTALFPHPSPPPQGFLFFFNTFPILFLPSFPSCPPIFSMTLPFFFSTSAI